MNAWWQRWRRARTLERRAIPDALWRRTLARFPFLAARSEDDLRTLREMATLFLADKEFSGTRGLAIDDDMAVAIAAQACLPALKLGFEWLDGFVGIVVHADAVLARREVEDDDGVVHAYDEELAGEAMGGGPVMLAWQEVDEAGRSAMDGYNVVVHEFAHVIDMRGGITAHPEQADTRTERGRWLRALAEEHEEFAARIDEGEETFLDPYAAESLEEFFAVAAEVFFVAPDELEAELPTTYALLRSFFRQDPARSRAAASSTPGRPA